MAKNLLLGTFLANYTIEFTLNMIDLVIVDFKCLVLSDINKILYIRLNLHYL